VLSALKGLSGFDADLTHECRKPMAVTSQSQHPPPRPAELCWPEKRGDDFKVLSKPPKPTYGFMNFTTLKLSKIGRRITPAASIGFVSVTRRALDFSPTSRAVLAEAALRFSRAKQ
jgi:hypothetical protein